MKSRFACTIASSLRSLVNPGRELKARVPNLRYIPFYLIIDYYDYSVHVGGLMPANLCLVERFGPQDLQMLNKKTSSNFKTKLTSNTAEASRVNCNTL